MSAFRRALLLLLVVAVLLPPARTQAHEACDGSVAESLTADLGLKKMGWRQCRWDITVTDSLDIIDGSWPDHGTFASRPACAANKKRKLFFVDDCNTTACTAGGGTIKCATWCNPSGFVWDSLTCDSSGGGASPGGPQFAVQINDPLGSFGGSSSLSFSSNTLSVNNKILPTAIAFASLGTPANGTIAYCNNCVKGSDPCAGAGTGSLAVRLNNTWVCSGGGGTPAGSNTEIQFNASGAFGADPDFAWDSTNNILRVGEDTTPATDAFIQVRGTNDVDFRVAADVASLSNTQPGISGGPSSGDLVIRAANDGISDVFVAVEDDLRVTSFDRLTNYLRVEGSGSGAPGTIHMPLYKADTGGFCDGFTKPRLEPDVNGLLTCVQEGSASAGGSEDEVQIHGPAGVFVGDPDFQWSPSLNLMTVKGEIRLEETGAGADLVTLRAQADITDPISLTFDSLSPTSYVLQFDTTAGTLVDFDATVGELTLAADRLVADTQTGGGSECAEFTATGELVRSGTGACSSATPGGNPTEIQFHDTGGVFAGDADFTWDKVNNVLRVGEATTPATDAYIQVRGTNDIDLRVASDVANLVATQPGVSGGPSSASLILQAGNDGTADIIAAIEDDFRVMTFDRTADYVRVEGAASAAPGSVHFALYKNDVGGFCNGLTAPRLEPDATGLLTCVEDIASAPGGSETEVQFHDTGGVLGGDPELVYDKTGNVLGLTGTLRLIDPTGSDTFDIATGDMAGNVAMTVDADVFSGPTPIEVKIQTNYSLNTTWSFENIDGGATAELQVEGLAGGTTACVEATGTGQLVRTPSGLACGAGSINAVPTPADNQIAVFTDADTVEGDVNFTWEKTNRAFTINSDEGDFFTRSVCSLGTEPGSTCMVDSDCAGGGSCDGIQFGFDDDHLSGGGFDARRDDLVFETFDRDPKRAGFYGVFLSRLVGRESQDNKFLDGIHGGNETVVINANEHNAVPRIAVAHGDNTAAPTIADLGWAGCDREGNTPWACRTVAAFMPGSDNAPIPNIHAQPQWGDQSGGVIHAKGHAQRIPDPIGCAWCEGGNMAGRCCEEADEATECTTEGGTCTGVSQDPLVTADIAAGCDINTGTYYVAYAWQEDVPGPYRTMRSRIVSHNVASSGDGFTIKLPSAIQSGGFPPNVDRAVVYLDVNNFGNVIKQGYITTPTGSLQWCTQGPGNGLVEEEVAFGLNQTGADVFAAYDPKNHTLCSVKFDNATAYNSCTLDDEPTQCRAAQQGMCGRPSAIFWQHPSQLTADLWQAREWDMDLLARLTSDGSLILGGDGIPVGSGADFFFDTANTVIQTSGRADQTVCDAAGEHMLFYDNTVNTWIGCENGVPKDISQGSPGGNVTELQFHDFGGVFQGDPELTYNKTADILTLRGALRFLELSGGSSEIIIKPPVNLSVNSDYTLPTADGSSGQTLHTTGTGDLFWGGINLATEVLGLLAPANGGTGITTASSSGIPRVASGTWSVSDLSAQLSDGLQDETGTGGVAVFSLQPTISAPLLTGRPVVGDGVGNDYLEFTEEATDPTAQCVTNAYFIWANSGGTLKKCENGTISVLDTAGTPAGNDTQVQFNDGGTAFGGDPELTYNKSGNILSLRGTLRFQETGGGAENITFQAASDLGGNTAYILPTADGSAGHTMHTDGAGNLYWSTVILSNEVVGLLPAANGGTGINSGSSSGLPRVASGVWSVSNLSSQLANALIDEQGTGSVVFATTPTITTPLIAGRPIVGDGAGNDFLEFTEESTDAVASCAANMYFLSANSTTGTLRKCENGVLSDLDSGDVSASGSPVADQVTVWTGASTITGDAGFTYDTAGNVITLKGPFRFQETGAGTEFVAVQAAAALAANTTYTLPTADGSTGHTLHTDGGGTLFWSQVNLGNEVVGLLPSGNGGTGLNTGSSNGLPRVASGSWSVSNLSVQLANAVTDETGTGSVVFATQPTITTPLLSGRPVVGDGVGNDYLEFTEEATDPTAQCATNAYFIWANSAGTLKKCENGTISNLDTSAITVSGTPQNDQLAVWVNSTTLEGDAALKFDTVTDTLEVESTAPKLLFDDTTASAIDAQVFVDANVLTVETGTGTDWQRIDLATGTFDLPAYATCSALGNSGKLTVDGSGNLNCADDIDTSADTLCAGSDTYLDGDGNCDTVSGDLIGSLNVVQVINDSHQHDVDTTVEGWSAWDSAVTKQTASLVISGVEVDFETGALEGYPRLGQSATPPATACDAAGEAGRLYFDTDADTDGSVFVCRGAAGWKNIDDDGEGGVLISGTPADNQLAVWINSTTIEGDAALKFDTVTDTLEVESTAPKFLFDDTTGAAVDVQFLVDGNVFTLETGTGTDVQRIDMATGTFDLPVYATCSALGNAGKLTVDGGGNLICAADIDTSADTLCAGSDTYLDGDGNCDTVSGDLIGSLNVVQVINDSHQHDIDISIDGLTAWDGAATKQTADLVISGVEVDFEVGALEGFPRLAQSTTPPATACDAAAEAGRLYFDSDADTDGSVFVCRGTAGWKNIDDDGEGSAGISGVPVDNQVAVWLNATTLEGDAGFVYDGATARLILLSTAPTLRLEDTSAGAVDAHILADANDLIIESSDGTDRVRVNLSNSSLDLPGYTSCAALGNAGKLTVDGSGNVLCAADIDTSADTLCVGTDTYLDGDGNCDTVSGDLIGSLNVVQVVNDSHQHDVDTSISGWTTWDSAVTKQTSSLIVSGTEVDFEGGAAEGFPRLGQSTLPPATACDAAGEAGRLYFDTDADTDGSVFVCRGTSGWKNIDDDGEGAVLVSGTPVNDQLAVWTNSTTIEGDSGLKFDTITDTLEIESTAPRFLLDDTTVSAVDAQVFVDANVLTVETGTGVDWLRLDLASGTFDLPAYTTCAALGNGGKLTVDGGGNLNCASDVDTDTDSNANTLCTGSDTYLDGDGNCDTVSGDLIGSLNVVQVVNDSHQHDIDISISGLTVWDGSVTKQTSPLVVSGTEVDFEGGAAEGFPRLGQSTLPPATACDAAGEAGRLYFDTDADTDGSVFVCRGVSGWKNIDDDGEGSVLVSGTPVNDQLAVWTSSTTIEGDIGLKFDTITDTLEIESTAPRFLLDDTTVSAVDAQVFVDGNVLTVETGTGVDWLRLDLATGTFDLPAYTTCAALGNAGKLTVDGAGNLNCASDVDTDTDSRVTVEEDDVTRTSNASFLNFGLGFDVTNSPAGQANVTLDYTEDPINLASAEIAGILLPASGGTGLDTSASTGVLRVSAGTWVVGADISALNNFTSAQLDLRITDDTGSGVAVFNTSPVFDGTPVIGNGIGNDKLEFNEESTNPSCGAAQYTIWANSGNGKLKKCENFAITDLDTNANTLCTGSNVYLNGDGACDVVSGDLSGSLSSVNVVDDSHFHDVDVSLTGWSDWGQNVLKTGGDLGIWGTEVDFEQIVEGFPRLAQSTLPPSAACDASAEAGRLYFDTDADTDGSVFVCRGLSGWKDIDDDGGHGDGTNCSAGFYPLGVDANGNAQSCTADDDIPETGDFGNAFDLDANGDVINDSHLHDVDSTVSGWGGWAAAVTKTSQAINIWGTEVNYENAVEGFPRLAQSATPPATECDAAAEAGRLYFDTDADVTGAVYVCTGAGGWKPIQHDNGSNCGVGAYARGVDEFGNAESCTVDDDIPEVTDFTNFRATRLDPWTPVGAGPIQPGDEFCTCWRAFVSAAVKPDDLGARVLFADANDAVFLAVYNNAGTVQHAECQVPVTSAVFSTCTASPSIDMPPGMYWVCVGNDNGGDAMNATIADTGNSRFVDTHIGLSCPGGNPPSSFTPSVTLTSSIPPYIHLRDN